MFDPAADAGYQTRMRSVSSSGLFTALVALALGLNLALLSPRVIQSAEDTVRGRLAQANNALRAQVDLADARQGARLGAGAAELGELLRPPADPTLPVPKPDEKSLRAAAAALQPATPDLLIVATSEGAVVSRRDKAAAQVDDVKPLPLVKAALEGGPSAPVFAAYDGQLFRLQAARVAGTAAVVVTGQLVDDKLATQLRLRVDADVTLVKDDAVVASSLAEPRRAELLAWMKSPGPGWGVLPLRLPLLGNALDGKLPLGGSRFAVRAAQQPMESGVMAVLTVSAFPSFGWIGRYQVFYLVGLFGFVVLGIVWSLLPRNQKQWQHPSMESHPMVVPPSIDEAAARAAATLAGANDSEPKPTDSKDVPWGPHDHPPQPKSVPPGPRPDEDVEFLKAPPTRAESVGKASASIDPPWADPLSPPPRVEAAGPATPAPFALHPPDSEEEPVPEAAMEPELPEGAITGSAEDHGHQPERPGLQQAVTPESNPKVPAAAPWAALGAPAGFGQQGPDRTNPGAPSAQLLAQARPPPEDETPGGYFPGDEPTRIEPVSAALLDKLREKDAEAAAGWGEPPAEAPEAVAAPPPADPWGAMEAPGSEAEADPPRYAATDRIERSPHEEPQPDDQGGLPRHEELQPEPHQEPAPDEQAQAAPAEEPPPEAAAEPAVPDESDADEAHFQETFQRFLDLRQQTGEPADKVSYDKFVAKLRKNREDLLARHAAKGVRFSVYLKDGKAAIKASAIR
jgi:hypothetical protein